MLLKMLVFNILMFIIHLHFIFVYYDCYVLNVLDIGQRATQPTELTFPAPPVRAGAQDGYSCEVAKRFDPMG